MLSQALLLVHVACADDRERSERPLSWDALSREDPWKRLPEVLTSFTRRPHRSLSSGRCTLRHLPRDDDEGVYVDSCRLLRANTGHSAPASRTDQVNPESPFKIDPLDGQYAPESDRRRYGQDAPVVESLSGRKTGSALRPTPLPPVAAAGVK
jgi:hypothetical protein